MLTAGGGMEGVVADADVNFNAYVGAESGILKGVCFGNDAPILKSFCVNSSKNKPPPIRSLCWADEANKELLVTHENYTIKVYNTKLKAFTQEFPLDLDDSPLIGLNKYESNYVVGQENGKVSVWNILESCVDLEINTGDHLCKIRHSTTDPWIFATGGKENDLKIWNLKSENPLVPIWNARNVRHDELELRVPVWIQDLTFLPQTSDLVAVATRHGHLRLYDTRVADNKNRPVVNMTFCDHPLMSIASTRNDRQVVVGSARGKLGLVDLRHYGKEKLVRSYSGANGSIRSIISDENTPFFVACGLDRYLYLYNVEEKAPVKKLYLQVQLTCAIITKNFMTEAVPEPEEDVKSTWHNIDVGVLPIPPPPPIKSEDFPAISPIKKSKRLRTK